jgi:hypothetical protein
MIKIAVTALLEEAGVELVPPPVPAEGYGYVMEKYKELADPKDLPLVIATRICAKIMEKLKSLSEPYAVALGMVYKGEQNTIICYYTFVNKQTKKNAEMDTPKE